MVLIHPEGSVTLRSGPFLRSRSARVQESSIATALTGHRGGVCMRRLAPAVGLFVFFFACLVQAQTCPPPTVTLVGGTNPTCAGVPVTIDAGSGWATYQWSPGGATTRTLTDSPLVTTSSTVTVTDANGCSVTSAPMTVTVGVDAAITAPADVCPSGEAVPSVASPASGGEGSSVTWQITNGLFSIPSYPYYATATTGTTVHFHSSASAPIQLSVHATDAQSCVADATATVGLRNIAPPVITAPTNICPNGNGTASVAPPAEGGDWQYVNWQITNGWFNSNNYPYQTTYASGPTVQFYPNGSGLPVTLTADGTDSQYFHGQSSVTIGMRSIAAPVITAPTQVCPNGGFETAGVPPPAEGRDWQYVTWQITNGWFNTNYYPYQVTYASGPTVQFYPDGSGRPVTLTADGTDSQYCHGQQSSVTIGMRSIAPPVITAPASICPNGNGMAGVAPPAEGGNWQYTSC